MTDCSKLLPRSPDQSSPRQRRAFLRLFFYDLVNDNLLNDSLFPDDYDRALMMVAVPVMMVNRRTPKQEASRRGRLYHKKQR